MNRNSPHCFLWNMIKYLIFLTSSDHPSRMWPINPSGEYGPYCMVWVILTEYVMLYKYIYRALST